IRPAIAYRPGVSVGEPPAGAADGDGFVVTVAMTSLTGCSGEAFASILRSLGYAGAQRPGPAITGPIIAAASTKPIAAAKAEAPAAQEGETPEHEAQSAVIEQGAGETPEAAAESAASVA